MTTPSVILTDDPTPCSTSSELFFSAKAAEVQQAQDLCTTCWVQPRCLAGAIARRETAGVWGGKIFRKGGYSDGRRKPGRRSGPNATKNSPPAAAPAAPIESVADMLLVLVFELAAGSSGIAGQAAGHLTREFNRRYETRVTGARLERALRWLNHEGLVHYAMNGSRNLAISMTKAGRARVSAAIDQATTTA